MKLITFVTLILLFLTINISTFASAYSCKAGRGACVASCMAQNCATGYCPNGTEGVCVCSRCSLGPVWPK
jgi:putative exporter of polyketide antibiotics